MHGEPVQQAALNRDAARCALRQVMMRRHEPGYNQATFGVDDVIGRRRGAATYRRYQSIIDSKPAITQYRLIPCAHQGRCVRNHHVGHSPTVVAQLSRFAITCLMRV